MAAKTMDEIASLLENVKFKKKLFGGVEEEDVWRVLQQMQTEYRSVVEAAEQRYHVLLDERNAIIHRQQKQLVELQAQLPLSEGGGVGG